MSLFEVERFIFKLKSSEEMQFALGKSDESVFEDFEIDGEERRELLKGDIKSLYKKGVHPLLLRPYSRLSGLSPSEYNNRLKALKGTHKLSSERQYSRTGE